MNNEDLIKTLNTKIVDASRFTSFGGVLLIFTVMIASTAYIFEKYTNYSITRGALTSDFYPTKNQVDNYISELVHSLYRISNEKDNLVDELVLDISSVYHIEKISKAIKKDFLNSNKKLINIEIIEIKKLSGTIIEVNGIYKRTDAKYRVSVKEDYLFQYGTESHFRTLSISVDPNFKLTQLNVTKQDYNIKNVIRKFAMDIKKDSQTLKTYLKVVKTPSIASDSLTQMEINDLIIREIKYSQPYSVTIDVKGVSYTIFLLINNNTPFVSAVHKLKDNLKSQKLLIRDE